jgi:hypothetical protein
LKTLGPSSSPYEAAPSTISGKVLLGSDDDKEEDMSENAIVKFSKRLIDSTDTMEGTISL